MYKHFRFFRCSSKREIFGSVQMVVKNLLLLCLNAFSPFSIYYRIISVFSENFSVSEKCFPPEKSSKFLSQKFSANILYEFVFTERISVGLKVFFDFSEKRFSLEVPMANVPSADHSYEFVLKEFP